MSSYYIRTRTRTRCNRPVSKCTVCRLSGHNRRTCKKKGKMMYLSNELLVKIGTYVDLKTINQYFLINKRINHISKYILFDLLRTNNTDTRLYICKNLITDIPMFRFLKNYIIVKEVLYKATYDLNFDLACYIYKKYNITFGNKCHEYNKIVLSMDNGLLLKRINFQNHWSKSLF